jgi:hypothetical protein
VFCILDHLKGGIIQSGAGVQEHFEHIYSIVKSFDIKYALHLLHFYNDEISEKQDIATKLNEKQKILYDFTEKEA